MNKAKKEYIKYQQKTLTEVEKSFLSVITNIETKVSL